MSRNAMRFLLIASALLFVGTGCESNVQKVQKGTWGSNTATYAEAFDRAFEDGVWNETEGEDGVKYVQYTGKISRAMHDFAVKSLASTDQKILFQFACEYLASLNSDGRAASDPEVTFDIAKLPVRGGDVSFERVGTFVSAPENRDLVNALNTFYLNRYWAAGTPVLLQWAVYSGGKVLKVVKTSNRHWDDDALFKGKPEAVMRLIFQYAAQ